MKLIQLLVLGFVISLISCKKDKGLFGFDIEYEVNFTIPSSAGVSIPISVATPPVSTSSSSKFSNNNTSANKIKQITLESLELTITSPNGKTFSFLESIKLYISADGLDEILLASKENISDAVGGSIFLETSEDSFAEYIKKDEFDIRTEVVTDETLVQDIDIRADMQFNVRASPL